MVHLMFIGTTELLLIAGIALLLFGGKKLPEMMRGLGQGVKQFKEGMKDVDPIEEEGKDAATKDGTAENNEQHVNKLQPENSKDEKTKK